MTPENLDRLGKLLTRAHERLILLPFSLDREEAEDAVAAAKEIVFEEIYRQRKRRRWTQMRPGEPIDWEFERFWTRMSPQWPGAIKETTRWYFKAGRLRIEDFLATATRIFDASLSEPQKNHTGYAPLGNPGF